MPSPTYFTPDHLGHGEAPRSASYKLSHYTNYLADRIRAETEGPLIFFGHSLGGLTGLALSAILPERIRGLVLEDPPLFSIFPP